MEPKRVVSVRTLPRKVIKPDQILGSKRTLLLHFHSYSTVRYDLKTKISPWVLASVGGKPRRDLQIFISATSFKCHYAPPRPIVDSANLS